MFTYKRQSIMLRSQSGFTLVELMVTIAIMAVLVSLAVPNFSRQIAEQRNKNTAYNFANAIKKAKVEAKINRQAQNYTIIDAKESESSSLTPSDTSVTILTLSTDGRVSNINDAVTVRVCDTNNTSASGYNVTVTPTARITLKEGVTCS